MGSQSVNILFAGGGTGGHLFPALAIADEIRSLRSDATILFVGTGNKIEARIVPARGYDFRTIWISGFQRRLRLKNLMVPLKVAVSLVQSFFILKRFQPTVVVGTGGYVAGPVLSVASLMGIPTIVHESNSFPGATTRMLSGKATRVFTSFEATRQWLRRQDNVEFVGNPTRKELGSVGQREALRFFGLDPDKKTLLVFGGSLGASSINRAIASAASELVGAGIQIIWQTGQVEYDGHLASEWGGSAGLWIGPFIEKMEYAYAAADLVVCRAGATTIAELVRLAKPAILIPYPHAAGNHQAINARTIVDAVAGEVINDGDLGAGLKETIIRLISDDEARRRMSANMLRLGNPNAAAVIANKVIALANR